MANTHPFYFECPLCGGVAFEYAIEPVPFSEIHAEKAFYPSENRPPSVNELMKCDQCKEPLHPWSITRYHKYLEA